MKPQSFISWLSKPVVVLIAAFSLNLIISFFFRLSDDRYKNILSGNDAKGYHEYLSWAVSGKNINYNNEYSYELNNQRFLKYPFGTALCQLPFYIVDTILETPSEDLSQVSYTEALLICIGASLFVALALVYITKIGKLLSLKSSGNLLAIMTLYFGTNLLCYSSIEPFMSHVYSLFAVSGFVYHLLCYKDSIRTAHFFISLLFLFLLIAIRPFNLIIAIPFICYVSYSLRSLKVFAVSLLVIFGAYICQIIIWYLQTGSLVYSSYIGEGFNWQHPEILNILFSFRKGLFIYSPLLLLGIVGLMLFFKYDKKLAALFLLSVSIYVYSVASWWHWPFGDSFGHRAFIDIYLFFGIGLAVLFHHIKRTIVKIGLIITTSLGTVLNTVQSWQYLIGILPAEYLTKDKYTYQFLYIDEASKNVIGGINDIIPNKQDYLIRRKNLNFVDMNEKEFSPKLSFMAKRNEALSYLKIDFEKEEVKAFQSEKSKLYFQINDSLGKGYYYYSILLNETPYDYEAPNRKSYSYQVKIPPLKQNDELTVMFLNPDKNRFLIRNVVMDFYTLKK